MNWRAVTWLVFAILCGIGLGALTNSVTISKNRTLAGMIARAINKEGTDDSKSGQQGFSIGAVSDQPNQTFQITMDLKGGTFPGIQNNELILNLYPAESDVRFLSRTQSTCTFWYVDDKDIVPKGQSGIYKTKKVVPQRLEWGGLVFYYLDVPSFNREDHKPFSYYSCTYNINASVFYNSNYQEQLVLTTESFLFKADDPSSGGSDNPSNGGNAIDAPSISAHVPMSGTNYRFPTDTNLSVKTGYIDNLDMRSYYNVESSRPIQKHIGKDTTDFRSIGDLDFYILSWEDPMQKQWRDIALVLIGGLFGLFAAFLIEGLKALHIPKTKAEVRQ